MIPEIAIKISFAEAPGAGGATAVLAASGGVEIAPPTLGADAAADMIPAPPDVGVEIAPPTLGADAAADMIPAPPDVGVETAAAAGIDVPPPPAAAAAEGEYLPPPGAEDEHGDPSDEDAPPPSPGRGAKRGR